ncbi:MAG: hypothetical protein HY319_20210 [Armatimonadetes bacterium]|nr:hypothetical protein [Armatimonadota bacterium]
MKLDARPNLTTSEIVGVKGMRLCGFATGPEHGPPREANTRFQPGPEPMRRPSHPLTRCMHQNIRCGLLHAQLMESPG